MKSTFEQLCDEADARRARELAARPKKSRECNGNGHSDYWSGERRVELPGEGTVHLEAKPWTWRVPSTIPPRRWLYGRHYIRKFVTTTIAPGGTGKSSLALVEALAMVTGRNLLGEPQPTTPLNVWYWNGEDPIEEIDRRIAAICKFFKISAAEIGGRLYVNSGRDTRIVVATRLHDQIRIAVPLVEALTRELREKQIDCLTLDPFVSTHGVPENDNGAIERVATIFADVADERNCSAELLHHTRKAPPGGESDRTVDDGRGASALIFKARSVRVLNVMSRTDAGNAGVEVDQRSLYFRIDNGKTNMQPPAEKAKWRKLVSVSLDNATAEEPADLVQVATKWEMPGMLDGVTPAHLCEVVSKVRADEEYRADPRATKWIGKLVASVIGADLKEEAGERKVKRVLKAWFASKVLAERDGKDTARRPVAFVEVGPGWDENEPAQV